MDEEEQMLEPDPTYGFEQDVGSMIYKTDEEKTFIDKVLDRKDSERLRQLMLEEELDRSELLELLYIIVSINTKLVNFTDWDRYLLGKFLAWIRDFTTLHEALLDYIEEYENLPENHERKKEIKQILDTLYSIRKHASHNLKFLVDIYLYLSNSTLSISGAAFDTLSKSRFEYSYPQRQYTPVQPNRKGLLDVFKGKGVKK
jgi:hypothetical protein